MQLDRLEGAIDYRFEDRELLERALSHRSVGRRNNERLEFLGDSALNHYVAERLFHRFPDADEGELSRMRAALVRGDTLAGTWKWCEGMHALSAEDKEPGKSFIESD